MFIVYCFLCNLNDPADITAMLPTSRKFEPVHVLVALPFSVTKRSFRQRQPACRRFSTEPFIFTHPSWDLFCPRPLTEAKTGALFHNAKDAAPFRCTLIKLGHPQGTTPIQTNNACALGIINNTVKQCRSKAMDMRFYWIEDRVAQGQYVVHWRKGSNNLKDYFIKQPSPSQHCLMRLQYLVNLHRPASLQGCVEPAVLPLPGYPQISTTDKPYCLALLTTNNLTRLHIYNHLPTHLAAALHGLILLPHKLSSLSLGLTSFHQ